MKRVPLHANVACIDGPFGETSRIIVDPKTLLPTHVVVKAAERSHEEYLVPVSYVAEVSKDLVRLNCPRELISKMAPFAVTEYHEVQIPRYTGPEYGAAPYAYSNTEVIEVHHERVPEGERAVSQGMVVVASDGKVGTVDELVLNEEDGTVTHFLMREKHLWGQKAVIVPLTVIDHVKDDRVYLKLDKDTLMSYLAIPASRRQAAAEMNLIILLVGRPGEPKKMLKTVQGVAQQAGIQLYGLAVLLKDAEGKAVIREAHDLDRRQGAVFGAITGGLLGLVGGPAGMVVGAVAGATTGGVAAKRIDLGLPDAYLQKLQSQLQPGSAAVVALAEAGWEAKATDTTFGLQAELLRHELDEDLIDQLPSDEA
ncbi:MAG: DUF1269 domain-containing protein [Chloroflexota bacterium]|jgi:uncharacterized membrane protein/sporulation protein YlmC with PRC-barrel domain